MNYIIESLLVGIYTSIIYLIITPFIKNIYILLLVVGFLKHLFGYILNIHTWYCNNGNACITLLNQHYSYNATSFHLLRDSLYDSFMFLILGTIICKLTKLNKTLLFFIIGFILHIISEQLLVHKYFCHTTCKKTNKQNIIIL